MATNRWAKNLRYEIEDTPKESQTEATLFYDLFRKTVKEIPEFFFGNVCISGR